MGIWSTYIYKIYIYHIYIYHIHIPYNIYIPYIYIIIYIYHIYIPYIYTCDHSISVKCIEMSSKWQVWCQDGIKSFLAQRFMGLLSQGGDYHLRFLAREDQNYFNWSFPTRWYHLTTMIILVIPSNHTRVSYKCKSIYILEKHQQVALGSLRWAFHPHIIDIS